MGIFISFAPRSFLKIESVLIALSLRRLSHRMGRAFTGFAFPLGWIPQRRSYAETWSRACGFLLIVVAHQESKLLVLNVLNCGLGVLNVVE
jgi:hypothetical protein